MGGVLSLTPLDLVDFLFYLQGFQVIEFRLVRLKFGMEFVLASFLLLMGQLLPKHHEDVRGPPALEA